MATRSLGVTSVVSLMLLLGAELRAAPPIIRDLYATAGQARWSNGSQPLPFPGSDDDPRGFVIAFPQARLQDGELQKRVLETHPEWKEGGLIVGRYENIMIPSEGAALWAIIGFLDQAKSTDGVEFEVRADYPTYRGPVLQRRFDHQYSVPLEAYSQDLSYLAGHRGTISLIVHAGNSSARDWAVWEWPRIVSLKDEPRHESFVGGAVGLRREGDRLIQPSKSGRLFGNLLLYLRFANVRKATPVRISTTHNGRFRGTSIAATVRPDREIVWVPLSRFEKGVWRETILYDGKYYVGSIVYQVDPIGE